MNALIKDALKLVVITVVAGIALGAVYGITKKPIARQEEKAQQAAYREVFPEAASFEETGEIQQQEVSKVFASSGNTVEGHEADVLNAVVEAKDTSGATLGYIFDITTSKGYGGNIEFTAGIKEDGTVTGYSILSISETAGLGMKAKSDPSWGQQFAGKQVDMFSVVKDGTGASDDTKIDAISGATITSKAMTGAMNNCIAYFKTMKGGQTP